MATTIATANHQRATKAQLRRAAGSQSLEKLVEALQGWTVQEVTDLAHVDDDKHSLHMAAWKGCLENVHFLLDWGCDVNVIATGTFSYGKTPIFFACTQCREEHVRTLLERGAHVKIVNNKGQSVLSIASSHFSKPIVDMIQQAEAAQSDVPWVNYRTTHSDGFTYGDLDPRFLDRPLRTADVVTDLAVNPTTRQSRKGGFLKKNPHMAQGRSHVAGSKTKAKSKIKKTSLRTLSVQELEEVERAWSRLAKGFSSSNPNPDNLWTILRLCDGQQGSWLPGVRQRLLKLSTGQSVNHVSSSTRTTTTIRKEEAVLHRFLQSMQCDTERDSQLRDKLFAPCFPSSVEEKDSTSTTGQTKVSAGTRENNGTNRSREEHRQQWATTRRADICAGPWNEAALEVKGLSLSLCFEQDHSSSHLALASSPEWIDTLQGLQSFEKQLLSNRHQHRVVAMDTEWTWKTKSIPMEQHVSVVSTLQLAVRKPNSNELQTWILDLLVDDNDFQRRCTALVQRLFRTKVMVGFALGQDMRKLDDWVRKGSDNPTNGKGSGKTHAQLDRAHIIDLQNFWSMKQPPGLASCAAMFASKQLSKEQQRSDWSRRPLTTQQLLYAGLDAAVLLPILAEKIAEEESFQ